MKASLTGAYMRKIRNCTGSAHLTCAFHQYVAANLKCATGFCSRNVSNNSQFQKAGGREFVRFQRESGGSKGEASRDAAKIQCIEIAGDLCYERFQLQNWSDDWFTLFHDCFDFPRHLICFSELYSCLFSFLFSISLLLCNNKRHKF